jgi:hypothetical protein
MSTKPTARRVERRRQAKAIRAEDTTPRVCTHCEKRGCKKHCAKTKNGRHAVDVRTIEFDVGLWNWLGVWLSLGAQCVSCGERVRIRPLCAPTKVKWESGSLILSRVPLRSSTERWKERAIRWLKARAGHDGLVDTW